MTLDPPPATGARVPWSALPDDLRTQIGERLGSPVRAARDQPGGFSPGVASVLELEDGERVFLKAAHPSGNPQTPNVHRREAAVLAAMPADAPVARLRWVLDEGPDDWVVLALDALDGRQPAVPWRPDELDAVLVALTELADALTPSPLPRELVGDAGTMWEPREDGWASIVGVVPPDLDPWSRRHLDGLVALEAEAAAAAHGESLLHVDIRADNLLLTADGVRVVDWPHARIGQAWVDLVWFAPSVAMQGGPDPESLLRRYSPADGVDRDALDAVIAAVAGYFPLDAQRPPLPGLPTLRPFQAAQGAAARRWLAARRGWT